MEAAKRHHRTIHRGAVMLLHWTLSPAMMLGIMSEQRYDDDATPARAPHNDGDLLGELRSEIAPLRNTLDAGSEARRRANHLVAEMIEAPQPHAADRSR